MTKVSLPFPLYYRYINKDTAEGFVFNSYRLIRITSLNYVRVITVNRDKLKYIAIVAMYFYT